MYERCFCEFSGDFNWKVDRFMNLWLELLILIVIGAVIGGVTNSLAIKMLFRPYRPIYLGRWRLPLTPGLIPKRRDELATQLGKTVMEHLLTPQSIRRKLADEGFQEEVLGWAKTQTRIFLENEESIHDLLASHFGVHDLKDRIEGKLDYEMRRIIEKIGSRTLEEQLPEKWHIEIEERIPEVAQYIAVGGAGFLESTEGRARIQELIDQFISGRGMLSNMLQMFLGGESVGDKVQWEIVKLLRQPLSRRLFESFLIKEWGKLKQRRLNELPLDEVAKEISAIIKREWPVERMLTAPIYEWSEPFREEMISKWVPGVIGAAGRVLTDRVGELLNHLRLEEVVKDQVETFAVERLEELVLSISRREFKMITYLGALLGGIIGLFQGLIIQLLS